MFGAFCSVFSTLKLNTAIYSVNLRYRSIFGKDATGKLKIQHSSRSDYYQETIDLTG